MVSNIKRSVRERERLSKIPGTDVWIGRLEVDIYPVRMKTGTTAEIQILQVSPYATTVLYSLLCSKYG